MAFDIYQAVTDRIIAELEQGIIPWEKPWLQVHSGAVKHRNGEPYSLLNQFLLGETGEYMSFLECKKAGGHIRKGAKSRLVVFWKWLQCQKKGADGKPLCWDDGSAIIEMIPYLKYSNVFHIRDCEGVEPKWERDDVKLNDIPADEKAEAILADYLGRSGVSFRNERQDKAFYRPSDDEIVVPLRDQFNTAADYYSTVFHESTHSTGHPTRLNRLDMKGSALRFGSQDYSKEELVAEIGASAILHEIGMETTATFRNSAAYIQSWLGRLRDDKKLIVSAAGKADKAVRMILNLAPPMNTDVTE